MNPEKDYYTVLQVSRGADQEVIAAAYKKLAQQYHPDVSDAPDATAVMRELMEAYETLSDPQRRAEYDERLDAGTTSEPQPGPREADTTADYYAVLGLAPGADTAAVEAAYDALSLELQPNVNEPPSDPQRLRELDEAFDVLDHPARRAAYDTAHGITAMAPYADAEAESAVSAPPPSRRRDRTMPIALGLLIAGIAALAVGGYVLVGALSDDDDSGGAATRGVEVNDTSEGTGAVAEGGKIATVHYTGTLEDGTEFDSSVGGAPLVFTLGGAQLIPGFDQGVLGMKVGGERSITIPPELGYGETGQGPIPPDATIAFVVRLLGLSDPSPDSPPEVEGDEIELESGLKAIDIVDGEGEEAATGSRVYVHYSGWLEADGTRFDSSLVPRQSGGLAQAFKFTIGEGGVIRGWDAGVPGMKEGGKRRLIIPAALGYGVEGSPPSIPSNANLIFDIELLEVQE